MSVLPIGNRHNGVRRIERRRVLRPAVEMQFHPRAGRAAFQHHLQKLGALQILLQQSDNVPLEQSRNVPSAILCLLKDAPLSTVWRSLQPQAVPYYMAGGLLAGVWSRADLAGSGVALMAAVSVYLLSLCYRETAERFGPADPGTPVESKA